MTEIKYYKVQYVDLTTGQFNEEEVSEFTLLGLQYLEKVYNNVQILSQQYTQTKILQGVKIVK